MYRLLIVDDEIDILDTLSFTLEAFLPMEKVEITKTQYPLEAVDLVEKGQRFNLIVSDLRMPRCDGYELTKKIRNFDNDVKIILFTGHGSQHDFNRFEEFGVKDFVNKPDVDKLMQTIMMAMG